MPLLNTSAIMDEIGFLPRKRGRAQINEILEENGLSLEESVIELKSVMDNTTDPHLKAKILDLILSMHGVKKDTAVPAVPQITFIFPSTEPAFLSGSSVDIKVEPALGEGEPGRFNSVINLK